jgi:hypothetical protein
MTIEKIVQENNRLKNLIDKRAAEIGFSDKIIYDGVAFPEKYIKSSLRILWILKEAYETNNRYGWHVSSIDKPIPAMSKNRTLGQVCRISYAVFFNCNYKEARKAKKNDLLDVLQQIGWININKIAAGKRSPIDLTDKYNIWKDILKDQIETYNPDIIMCGNTLQYLSWENYFEKPANLRKPFKEGKQYCYYPLKDRLYINIHHPSFLSNWNKRTDEIINAVLDWKQNYRGK